MALLTLTLEKGSHELKSHTLDPSVEDQEEMRSGKSVMKDDEGGERDGGAREGGR